MRLQNDRRARVYNRNVRYLGRISDRMKHAYSGHFCGCSLIVLTTYYYVKGFPSSRPSNRSGSKKQLSLPIDPDSMLCCRKDASGLGGKTFFGAESSILGPEASVTSGPPGARVQGFQPRKLMFIPCLLLHQDSILTLHMISATA